MRILSMGLDSLALNKSSALSQRAIEYGNLVEKYTVIVPSQKNEKIELSEEVMAHGSGGGNKIVQIIKLYFLAKKFLYQGQYDIITVQDQYYLALIGLYLSRKFKIGLEIQVHGFEKYCGLRRLAAKYVLPRAGAVRCVSQRLKKQLVGEFGVAESKITVVPIFIDTALSLRAQRSNLTFMESNQRLPRRPDYGAPRNDMNIFVFLTVGRLVPVKNIVLQIEAMAEVIKKYPNIELWIIGDGPERRNYKLRIKNYELEKNIKLLGWKDNLVEYYNQADAFMLTSNSEGWGLAVIEAAGHGLPIIMTDVGCAGEVIKNNESGMIIPVGDKARLIEAMIKLINDSALREKLGERAKMSISRLPTREQTLGLYKKSWQIARDSQ